jgi:hypothetical protein
MEIQRQELIARNGYAPTTTPELNAEGYVHVTSGSDPARQEHGASISGEPRWGSLGDVLSQRPQAYYYA